MYDKTHYNKKKKKFISQSEATYISNQTEFMQMRWFRLDP